MSATAKLEELRDAHAAQAERESQLKAEAVAAVAEVRVLEEGLTEAFKAGELSADGSTASDDVATTQKALLKARQRAAEPWRQRIEAAHRASEQRRGEVELFVNERLSELADELKPDAEAAAERLEAALTEVLAARGQWEAVASRFAQLLGPVQGLDGSDLPQSGADQLAAEVESLLGAGIRPPLPRTLYAPAGSPLAERGELLTGEREPLDAA